MELSEKNQSNGAEKAGNRSKRHRLIKIVLSVVATIAFASASYVPIGKHYAKSLTKAYLKDKGYQNEDIHDITVKHSFVRKLFGYAEWDILVIFQDEQDVTYSCNMINWELRYFEFDKPSMEKGSESVYLNILHSDWLQN